MKKILLVLVNLLLLSSFSQAVKESSMDPWLKSDKKANNTETEAIIFADYKRSVRLRSKLILQENH